MDVAEEVVQLYDLPAVVEARLEWLMNKKGETYFVSVAYHYSERVVDVMSALHECGHAIHCHFGIEPWIDDQPFPFYSCPQEQCERTLQSEWDAWVTAFHLAQDLQYVEEEHKCLAFQEAAESFCSYLSGYYGHGRELGWTSEWMELAHSSRDWDEMVEKVKDKLITVFQGRKKG